MIDLGVASRTVVPIFLLVGAGWLARRAGLLGPGAPAVLNGYLYWFALPALFTVDISRARLGRPDLPFLAACVLPLLVALAAIAAAAFLLRLPRRAVALLAVGTVFGSLAFFGIPFVMFAFPGTGSEQLGTLAAAVTSIPAVGASLGFLEAARLDGGGALAGARTVAARLARNQLLLSIAAGAALSLARLPLPFPVERPLHMLGTTTATVGFFMLGTALYGRRYVRLPLAAALALVRLALLPLVALGAAALVGLTGVPRDVVVLMHGMPVAVSMLVLAERYDLYPELVGSLILVSSAGAALTLNVWLAILATR